MPSRRAPGFIFKINFALSAYKQCVEYELTLKQQDGGHVPVDERVYHCSNMEEFSEGRGLGKWRGATPEPMELPCKIIMIILIITVEKKSTMC